MFSDDLKSLYKADGSVAMFHEWFAFYSSHHIFLAFQATDALPGVPP